MKKVVALFILFLVVLSISGCVENNFCKELERELAKNNVTCHCVPTKFLPEEYENISAEPKCSCLCYSNGVWINTTIAIAGNETTSKVLRSP